jgi:hypothetical protein
MGLAMWARDGSGIVAPTRWLRAGAPPLLVLPLLPRPGAALPALPRAPLLQCWSHLRHRVVQGRVDGLVHGHLEAASLFLKCEQVFVAVAPVA